MKRKEYSQHGFTIIELVIVIAIIAILTTVLIPTFSNAIEKAKTTTLISKAKNAYTEYITGHATIEKAKKHLLYENTDDGRIVTLENGIPAQITIGIPSALKLLFDDPDTPINEANKYEAIPIEGTNLYTCKSTESASTNENETQFLNLSLLERMPGYVDEYGKIVSHENYYHISIPTEGLESITVTPPSVETWPEIQICYMVVIGEDYVYPLWASSMDNTPFTFLEFINNTIYFNIINDTAIPIIQIKQSQ